MANVTYEEAELEAQKPAKERNAIIETKNGKKIPRRYQLPQDEVDTLLQRIKDTGVIQNPYKRKGAYYSFVQALINLGANEIHSFQSVKVEVQKVMSSIIDNDGVDMWTKFVTKKSKSIMCAKDVNGRLLDIPNMLQRVSELHRFGIKLSQIRVCVDILDSGDGIPSYRLNSNFGANDEIVPINEIRNKNKRGRKKKI